MVAVPCVVCGTSEALPLFVRPDLMMGLPGKFRFVRCRRCGFEYLNPRPAEIGAWYPPQYTDCLANSSLSILARWRLRRRAAWAHEAVRGTTGRVLEIGCGDGGFLQELRNLGMDAEGLDFSPTAVGLARRRGLQVQQGSVEDAGYPAECFDLVVMRHVLEHLRNPAAALGIVRGWLRPGGHVMIEVPNWDSLQRRVFGRFWHGYDSPRHFFAFAPKDLETLFGVCGFRVVWLRQLFCPGSWVNSFQSLAAGWGFTRPGWGTRPARVGPVTFALYLPALAEVVLRRAGIMVALATRQ
ncbi:MAG: class I SAM-dependent methyltransferase [Candidatus Rokubacteria bacterium]|nr:class I SAM-dependent methyltransferase [Candidatus Rokubacteria bacterium]